ncbi:MAG TPA: general secretion pathway protein GspF, partial [Gammaproteobacteria bacterium]|nr:general secretion pathway protein GspF [Gammaproteobacteria bacterium]
SKLGLPGDMRPDSINPATNTSFINTDFGLGFHASSALLQGIQDKAMGRSTEINGAVIPARSDNDTGNNPHNPMYGIARAGADGSLLSLIGSNSSDSGGNSMAPAMLIDPSIRPTKVDRPSDVTGMVDTGQLIGVLGQDDAVAVMESIERISKMKLDNVDTRVTADAVIKDLVRCGYVKAADIADRFGDPSTLDPSLDPDIVGGGGIFSQNEFNNDSEFRKTASVMKMVVNGFAGAGTISMGGYDYHTGDRATGELRDLRAGRCIGACLEYAARANNGGGVPLMIYVFSDGSVFSNGMTDDSQAGGGKGVWTGDNSSTACSFFLVYNPGSRPILLGAGPAEQALHQQIGYFRGDGSVETSATPAANQVNLLVETVILNYMALHNEQNNFSTLFPNHGLGNAALMDSLTAFNAIVSGTI